MATRTVILALLFILAPAGAMAQSSESTSETEGHWYGYQTLAVDGIAFGIAMSGDSNDEGRLAAGGITMAFGASLVHAAHGRLHAAALSLGARVLLGFAVSRGGTCDPDYHHHNGPCILSYVTVGLAAAIADCALARHTWPKPHDSDSDSVTWAPQLGVTGNGVSAGIGGTF